MSEQNKSEFVVGPNGMNVEEFRKILANKFNDNTGVQKAANIDPVLTLLLQEVKKVDFHLELNVGDTVSLKNQHYLVVVVEQLIKLANQRKWGLCVRNGHVYVYNDRFWKPTTPEEFKSFLGKVAAVMGIEPVNAKYYVFQEQLYKQFFAVARLAPPQRKRYVVLINFKNGTFEVTPQGHRLRDFSRNDFLTYELPFDYNPDADCVEFKKFLQRVLPNATLQLILAEFIGYVFAKHLKLDKCLILFGSGANGKSVFFEIIKALLGIDNVSFFTLKNLNEEKNRALIVDKLLNYGSEINASIETDIFKVLASGEPVQARRIYQDPLMIDDYARLAFNCNELPKDVEHNEAYFRRFLIIPFNVTIPEEERDPELAQRIIKNELSAVFNWVLQGLDSLLKNKCFTYSSVVTDMINEYKLESDSVYQFITDAGYEKSSEPSMPLKSSYDEYSLYCAQNGYPRLSNKKFSKRLRQHGIPVQKAGAGGHVFVFVKRKKVF
jgi:putative DNA primase/helicase